MRSVAAILVLTAAVPTAAEDKPIPERWTLKLLPDMLPELPDALFGKTWAHQPPRSRTGRGHSDFLTFHKAAADKAARVDVRQIVHVRFGQEDKETNRITELRVLKSLLEFDNQLRSAYLHQSVLAVNAAVPAGERTWYLVHSESFAAGKSRVNEWLFKFADDPYKQARGSLTVSHARNVFPDRRPEQWDVKATFEVEKDTGKHRTLNLKHDIAGGRPRHNLPKLVLGVDRPYFWLDEPNAGAIEYKLAK